MPIKIYTYIKYTAYLDILHWTGIVAVFNQQYRYGSIVE